MLEFALVAEGKNDEQVIPCLADRVLCEGEDWIRDNFEDDPERLWKWTAIETDPIYRYTSWVQIARLANNYKKKLRIYSRPGEGYRTAETRRAIALCVLLRRNRQTDALILARDLDNKPDEHRRTMETVRQENQTALNFPIILATPNRVVEAWMLHGFVCENQHEEDQLMALRKEFGFDPCTHGHELHPDDAKVVISKLISDAGGNKNMERRERCWADTDLNMLRERGKDSHLAAFLDEIKNDLLPLLTGKPTTSN
jgi:hypothetical protein